MIFYFLPLKIEHREKVPVWKSDNQPVILSMLQSRAESAGGEASRWQGIKVARHPGTEVVVFYLGS